MDESGNSNPKLQNLKLDRAAVPGSSDLRFGDFGFELSDRPFPKFSPPPLVRLIRKPIFGPLPLACYTIARM